MNRYLVVVAVRAAAMLRLNSRRFGATSALVAGLLPLLLVPALASAQAAAENSDEDLVGEVIVTGSRIARTGFDAPSPTLVLDASQIEAGGVTNVVDALNEMPSIGNGNFNTNTSFSFGNVGLSQLNLRELGVHRTLTIVNGRRRVGTPDDANFLALDVGNIPVALIDRVEVLTGGTSAVYGADAVAGVVNIILKDDFEGIEFGGQFGADERGDYDDSSYEWHLVKPEAAEDVRVTVCSCVRVDGELAGVGKASVLPSRPAVRLFQADRRRALGRST